MAKQILSATIPFGESELNLETGKLAPRASGSVLIRHGDTVLLVAVTVAKEGREGVDFFPMTVDFEERLYAAGKISGSKFMKREGRPSEEAILKSRIVDRSIRPMFPKGFRRDVQIIITALSYDEEHDPATLAVIGASAALLQTNAPFEGPIAAVRVGHDGQNFILNPTESQLADSRLDLLVAGTEQKVTMIEAQANEVSEEVMQEGMRFAHEGIVAAIKPQETFRSQDKEKVEFTEPEHLAIIKKELGDKINEAVLETNLDKRQTILDDFRQELVNKFKETYTPEQIAEGLDAAFLKAIRSLLLEKKHRPDGRGIEEIRPISIETNLLPRVHGSALFNRGETQDLTIVTLGGPGEEQWIDTMEDSVKKRYIHHYNFPPYSVGEVKMLRAGGRREIGHGALAEKALVPVLPSKEDFPYTIRLVSEILSSNGSSSMAATSGSSLALMDAGVPIKKAVAGIAMGLVSAENDEEFLVLTDLQGLEDFAGEMDFKIAGTDTGITAIQLDVKNKGLTEKVIAQTFTDAKKARMVVLEKMAAAIKEPRAELSKYAPRIISTKIDPEKIGELIGPGGKVINKIIDDHGGREIVNIDIEDDGTVMITSNDPEVAQAVKAIVESIGVPIEVGQEFEGEIVSIVKDRMKGNEIGAIVQLTPNADGMIHISALGNGQFVKNVSDVVQVGQTVKVKVKDVDPERGRISLIKVN